jgi:hypothetical protein
MSKKVKLYGCPDCGSEMTSVEVIKSHGCCKFCTYGDKYGEKLEFLGEFEKSKISKNYCLEEIETDDELFDEYY